MIETHPFKVFSPPRAKYLLLGSFVAVKKDDDNSYDWYYGSKRNQFWQILEAVYNLELKDKKAKQKLFIDLSIAITDIIYQCERRGGSSLDTNLIIRTYNTSAIKKLLSKNPIENIFFSSKYVEKEYKKRFKDLIKKYPEIKLVTLPSPSPRYAAMTKKEKIRKYKQLLPKVM